MANIDPCKDILILTIAHDRSFLYKKHSIHQYIGGMKPHINMQQTILIILLSTQAIITIAIIICKDPGNEFMLH